MKRFAMFIALLALLMTASAACAASVPQSVLELPAIPAAPDAPGIIRCVQSGDAVSIRFDRTLPAEHMLSFLALDASYRTQSIRYAMDDERTAAQTQALPSGGAWLRIELAWVEGRDNASAVYNMAGGLVSRTQYDGSYNGYVFDTAGTLTEYQDEASGVWTRFSESGKTTCYSYETDGMRVWFDLAGSVLWATYAGDGYECTWEDGCWYVQTPAGNVKVQLALDPRQARPLVTALPEPTPTTEVVWYPNNTINLAGLSLKEASKSLPDKWYNVVPVDLTHNGRQTYFLTISNARFIGECYVDVWDDEVTVTCALIDRSGIELKSEYGRWFTKLSQITTSSIESTAKGFTFGVPVSISRELGGADVALLFIRSKATYRQPFRDGTELTRYWRNIDSWKAFRKDLTALMKYVEK
ncbi:MAG: hypothetical protein IJZ74_06640 [Clostridia bacterium]|nr:hypothetical protein [Clostridia bacterium]